MLSVDSCFCFTQRTEPSTPELLISSLLVGEDQGGGSSALTRSVDTLLPGASPKDPPPWPSPIRGEGTLFGNVMIMTTSSPC